jgi:hypothetical protein
MIGKMEREALERFVDELDAASTDMHAAMDELDAQRNLAPAAREALDALPEDRAPRPSTPVYGVPALAGPPIQSSPVAQASAAVPFLDDLRELRERIEQQLPSLVAGSAGDSYDLLLALKQESGKLNDTLYGLWLRQAYTSLKQ